MRLKRSPELNNRARELGLASTQAEARLWQHLRVRNPFGVKFRRQRAIGPYIVDFYCPEFALVIELDGSQHLEADARIYDEERTAFLEARGLRVLRVTNSQALGNLDEVLELIGRFRPSP